MSKPRLHPHWIVFPNAWSWGVVLLGKINTYIHEVILVLLVSWRNTDTHSPSVYGSDQQGLPGASGASSPAIIGGVMGSFEGL